LEATKPEDSEYWEKRKRSKQAKKAKASKSSKDSLDAKLSMSWEQEAKDLIAMTPPGIIEMAINNVEDFARDMGVERITKTVVLDQMKSIGMDPSMLN